MQFQAQIERRVKKVPIPVVFHNLKNYDGLLLMQAMSRVRGERNACPTTWKNTSLLAR